jgi:hypothetical protein
MVAALTSAQRVVIIAGMIFAIFATIILIRIYVRPSSAKQPMLYVDCHPGELPELSTGKSIFAVRLLHPPNGGSAGGLMELFSFRPDNSALQKGADGRPVFAQRCVVQNDGSDPMVNIEANLRVAFIEAVGDRKDPGSLRSGAVTLRKDWVIYIARLDPGPDDGFPFYVWNTSPDFVTVSVPDSATAWVTGQGERRIVPVLHPPMEHLSFAPSSETNLR